MIFGKRKPVEKKAVVIEFKSWGDYSKEELVRIAKMLHEHAYGSVDLNFNDTFAPAAWGVECMEFDLLVLTELFEEFGDSGVIAWGAVKEGVDKPMKLKSYPKFQEAKELIEANRAYYFWDERMKLKEDLK